jgi:Zn finger protein HypA/HybF involved in hydrogenase expression
MSPVIDEDEEPLATCEECGAECSPEDMVEGQCPDCYARSLGPPEGCEAEE